MKNDNINHPKHYTSHPSGVECIQITEHMGFNLGNALKYVWRADLKDNATEDMKKAIWYINRELEKRKELPEDSQVVIRNCSTCNYEYKLPSGDGCARCHPNGPRYAGWKAKIIGD